MAATADNTAKNLNDHLDTKTPAGEPSMEDILASIKQIIADDEQHDDKTARENFTHPTDPSNSNERDPFDMDMEAALEEEIQLTSDDDEAFDNPIIASAVAPVVVDQKFGNAEVPDVEPVHPIEDRAARVRAELSAAGAGLSADERLEQYRIRGRLKMETLAQEQVARDAKREDVKERVASSIAAGPVLPSTNAIAREMADTMLNEKADELRDLVGEMMRPTIRQWLSDNLPTMVERLVREEIEAVSRGRKKA